MAPHAGQGQVPAWGSGRRLSVNLHAMSGSAGAALSDPASDATAFAAAFAAQEPRRVRKVIDQRHSATGATLCCQAQRAGPRKA